MTEDEGAKPIVTFKTEQGEHIELSEAELAARRQESSHKHHDYLLQMRIMR